ncbi:phage tail protein [uncultured Ruminococcus sp.]|uniref:phage tail protein n=1 Tax=uncultured Ruminococcus sp. TaxID=165186 RepID=UPI00292CF05C|nr:phage tail protein [uncultured Ruminococcus sp.]
MPKKNDFGFRFGIEGEAELKEALSEINSSYRVLTSEMKEATSRFDKNDRSIQNLTNQNEIFNKSIEKQREKLSVLNSLLSKTESALEAATDAESKANKKKEEVTKQYEDQKAKVESLNKQLSAATSEYGKNSDEVKSLSKQLTAAEKELSAYDKEMKAADKETSEAESKTSALRKAINNYQVDVNNTQAKINTMTRQLEQNTKEMDNLKNSTDKAGEEIKEAGKSAEKSKGFFAGLGDTLKAAGAAMGAVVVATGAAAVKLGKEVVKLGKEAVEAFADYEQLVGGVETLFKDGADEVQKYAENAFKTSGLSANEYMETVTGFSASLIQSLGGDTEKAAKMADMAITDMSDNANKMGTDMASIQNAYQGFAKQNYTMLDNLKLGYGGTKTEMERLLKDAQAISGIDYNIDSYADIVDAIHVIQTEMGITGTTAKEASTTIQGSMGMVKSSWQNLLTGLASGDKDFAKLMKNMNDSVLTFGKNLLPVVKNVLSGLGELVKSASETLLPEIMTELPALAEELIPIAITSAETLISSAIEVFPDLLSVGLSDVLPRLVTTTIGLVQELASSLSAALPDIMVSLSEGLVTIVNELYSPENLTDTVDIIIGAIEGVIAGLRQALPILIQGATTLVQGLITALPEVISLLIDEIPNILDMLFNSERGLLSADNVGKLVDGAVDAVIALVNNLPTIISNLIGAIPTIISKLFDTENGFLSVDNIKRLVEGAVKITVEIVKNLPKILWELIRAIPDIIDSIMDAFSGIVDRFLQLGREAVLAFADAFYNSDFFEMLMSFAGNREIYDAGRQLYNNYRGIGKHAEGGVAYKPTVGIVGDNGPEAIIPLKNNTEWIYEVAKEFASINATLSRNIYSGAFGNYSNPRAVPNYNVNVNFGDVTINDGSDIENVAHRVSDIIVSDIMTQGGAYA